MGTENRFPDAVNKHFNFLVDLGFIVYEKLECDKDAFGNGYYRFKSDTVGVEIVLGRQQGLVRMVPCIKSLRPRCQSLRFRN
jgi:hypothetical protein